jgi:hypothetical protein
MQRLRPMNEASAAGKGDAGSRYRNDEPAG